MPVDASRLIRKVRGGAQAHLIEAADGHCYVVKFVNNPQHRRVLVNDWIGSSFLRHLGLSTPEAAMVRLTPEFIAANPDLHIQLGARRIPPEPGWHFGSRFPGDPVRTVVYDYLPDVLLDQVENRAEFAGMLAFDQWTGNADSRQAIFFRARLKEWGTSASIESAGIGRSNARSASTERASDRVDKGTLRQGFVAQTIDHGFLFDGPHWRFSDSPLRGLYHRPLVYRGITGLPDFEPWLERIVHFPEEVIDWTVKQIPPAWLEGDEEDLAKLLAHLLRRRKRVPDLVEACRGGRVGVLTDWR
jgi:hypothetical protein